MKRFDILNFLIKKNNYKSFLEIGTQAKINFNNVKIDKKVCVDPDNNVGANYPITSDEFFKINNENFDIIFIDGLHHADVVYRDIINSLKILNENGTIVVHDVIPASHNAQVIPMEKAYNLGTIPWNGDVWKAWIKIRTERKDLSMRVVNTDHGCGIIKPVRYGEGDYLDNYCNGYYKYDEFIIKNNLNLISVDEFVNLY